MIIAFLMIALVLMLLGWPLLPGAIKHSEQDKRRAAYQEKVKAERARKMSEQSKES